MHVSIAIADTANLGTRVAIAGALILSCVKAKSLETITRFIKKNVKAFTSNGDNILGCLMVFRIAYRGAAVALIGSCCVKDSRGLRGDLSFCLTLPVVLLLSALFKAL